MSTYLTGEPSSVTRNGEQVVGRPYSHLPAFLFCSVGERQCGWRRTARTEADILTMTAEKREHEAACKGGLILARAGEHA